MLPQKTHHHVLHTNLQKPAKPKAEQTQQVSQEDMEHSDLLGISIARGMLRMKEKTLVLKKPRYLLSGNCGSSHLSLSHTPNVSAQAGRGGSALVPWYLVSDDLPIARGQRVPPERAPVGIQPQLLRFVRHWKHRQWGHTRGHEQGLRPEEGAGSSWPWTGCKRGSLPRVCPLQRLRVLQQWGAQRCGVQWDKEKRMWPAQGSPSPFPRAPQDPSSPDPKHIPAGSK